MAVTLDSGLTLYDINKQFMEKEKQLDPIELNAAISAMASNIANYPSQYFMLLCNERKDYTVFHLPSEEISTATISKDLKEILSVRGYIVAIDPRGDDITYEIWIKDFDTKEMVMYLFFDYSFGVVEFGE